MLGSSGNRSGDCAASGLATVVIRPGMLPPEEVGVTDDTNREWMKAMRLQGPGLGPGEFPQGCA